LLAMATLFALPLLALPAALSGEAVVPPLVRGALLGAAVFVVLVIASTVFLTADRIVVAVVRVVARLHLRVRPHHAVAPDELVDRVIESRDLVRKTLAGAWKRAVPAAIGNQLFDVLAL